jgi:glutathione S-transferase
MKLYSGPVSLFTAKVRIALAEKRLEYERIEVQWSLENRYLPHHPEVAALNPKGEVPVLVDGELVAFDSTIILEYLEDRYLDPPLYPRDPVLRARCRQFEAAADEIIFPNVWDLVEEGLYPAATGERDPGRLREAQDALSQRHAELDKRLADVDFLCGDFSIADIGTFIMLSSGAILGAPVGERCTNLHGWLERLGKRPAFAAEMIGMQSFLAGVLKPTA